MGDLVRPGTRKFRGERTRRFFRDVCKKLRLTLEEGYGVKASGEAFEPGRSKFRGGGGLRGDEKRGLGSGAFR